MKSLLSGGCLLFISMCTLNAQRICGTVAYKQTMLNAEPSLKAVFFKIEQQIAADGKLTGVYANRDTTANEIIHIPVVIHILYKTPEQNISDAQAKSQLTVLNNDFRMLNADRVNTPKAFKPFAADAGIQFCLAQVDPTGKNTTGIERKYTVNESFTTDDAMKMPAKGGAASWDSKHYLNIWVCNLSSSSVGYATVPGTDADRDGVVIAYDVFGTTGSLRPVFNKGRTATHEIGHWLGLIHTWGDDNCGDDQVDDTPTQQSYNFGCQQFPKLSACSPNGNGDMFMDFMDFSDDACMNMFTKGQVKRMRALFAESNYRNSFLTAFACDSLLSHTGLVPAAGPVNSISLGGTKVYPSPVVNVAVIECKAATAMNVKTAYIFNSVGVRVFTATLNQEKTVLNLTKLAAGLYFIKIGDNSNQFTTRIIKQ